MTPSPTPSVDRLFTLFGYFFGGFILLLIGYSVVPALWLFAVCCIIGTLTFVTGVAGAIYWAKSNK